MATFLPSQRSACYLALALLAAVPPTSVHAAKSEWKDLQGTTFRAEPVEVLGPFALFRNSLTSGRRVLLRGFPPEEVQRFYREASKLAPPAAAWSASKALATGDLPGNALRLQGKELVPAALDQQPEPELLIVLFGSYNNGESWRVLPNFIPTYRRIQQLHPGLAEAVFVGFGMKPNQFAEFAHGTNTPWLVADPNKLANLTYLTRFAPAEGASIVVLSRGGVPLLSLRGLADSDMRAFIDELSDLLQQLAPDNPRTWKDRLHYLQAVRPLQFASASTGPVLVGNPLRADGLRQRKVSRVVAQIAVGADGRATDVTITPDDGVPAALLKPLGDALLKGTAFAPAIQNGAPVAATYDYRFEVPAADAVRDASAAWMGGLARVEVPLNDWLVLKPIHVPQQDFVQVDRVDDAGITLLKPVQAGLRPGQKDRASQINAFTNEWFEKAGAASVTPKEGDVQGINDEVVTWKKKAATAGYVDLQEGTGNVDYCIGYAWTEFDSPADLDAWLSLGSDDGVKIWFNGTLVHDRWIRRPSRIDDEIVPLRLRAGKNQLLIKIQNVSGAWSFISTLRARDPR